MKNQFVCFILICIAIQFFGCQGKQGDPGPAGKNGIDGTNGTNGANGATGPQGPQGPAGPAGSSGGTYANGAVKAIVSGTTPSGIAFSDSIDYRYANGYDYVDNNYNGYLTLIRYQFLSSNGGNYSPYIELQLSISNLGTANQEITSLYLYGLNFFTLLSENELLNVSAGIGGSPDSYTVHNFNYNTTNGLFTFDFTIISVGADNSTQNPLTISGSFSGTVYVEVGG